MLSPIHVRHFWNFWENILHRNWVLSQLAVWIFISELFIDISSNSAYFPRLITLELPKSPNSNYLKLTIKDSTVLWSPFKILPASGIWNTRMRHERNRRINHVSRNFSFFKHRFFNMYRISFDDSDHTKYFILGKIQATLLDKKIHNMDF